MTFEDFAESIEANSLPSNISPLLATLWHDAKGNWKVAHEIAQSKEGTRSYDHLHAYLHRKEGDDWNADYWYRRCGESNSIKSIRAMTLQEEWESLARKFSNK